MFKYSRVCLYRATNILWYWYTFSICCIRHFPFPMPKCTLLRINYVLQSFLSINILQKPSHPFLNTAAFILKLLLLFFYTHHFLKGTYFTLKQLHLSGSSKRTSKQKMQIRRLTRALLVFFPSIREGVDCHDVEVEEYIEWSSCYGTFFVSFFTQN